MSTRVSTYADVPVATERRSGQRYLRGYAASRRAYDQRRRSRKWTPQDAEYAQIVRRDPCGFCGGERHRQIAVDHIDPLEAGGRDEWTNFTAACRACNASKRDKPLLIYLAERRRG